MDLSDQAQERSVLMLPMAEESGRKGVKSEDQMHVDRMAEWSISLARSQRFWKRKGYNENTHADTHPNKIVRQKEKLTNCGSCVHNA